MNMVFVLPVYKPAWGGGVLTAMAPVCEDLAARGHDVTVYCSADDGKGGTVEYTAGETTNIEGVEVHFFDFILPKNLWSYQFHRALWEAAESADIVHVSGMYKLTHESVRRVCNTSDTPYVFTPHGTLSPKSIRANNTYLKLGLVRTLVRPFLRDAAAIHYTSRNEQDKVESVVPIASRTRATIIPNGIDVGHYASGCADYERLGLPEDRSIVLFVGRLVPNKGAHLVIQGAAKTASERPCVVLVGPEENASYGTELRELARPMEVDVVFAGEVSESELLDYYASSDILALPSVEENFGMVVAEAAAAGTPSVLTKGVDIHPLVSEFNAGRVVERDANAISEGLREVLDAGLDENAAQMAQLKFPIDSVAAELLELYKSVGA